MGRSVAAFAESLKTNVSLYFPFLVYYQISYYKSSIFDLQEVGQLARDGFPADVQTVLGPSLPAASLTLKALVSAALIAADPDGISPRSNWLLVDEPVQSWLGLNWYHEVGDCLHLVNETCWPLFGALAMLRDSAWPVSPTVRLCSEASTSFWRELRLALSSYQAVPLLASLELLESPEECPSNVILRADAKLAVADWARRESLQEGGALEGVGAAIEDAQLLIRQVLGGSSLLGMDELSAWPGGSELFWLLDRLQCATEVLIRLQKGRAFLGAENIGMRSDADISYTLLLFPYRELVSDFIRARRVPYCNESILREVEKLASRLQSARAHKVRVVEVGANLGDCSLWIAKRLQALPSLRSIKVVALEALPDAAALFRKSVEKNGLAEVIQVLNVAAGSPGHVHLTAKPSSSNSFTLAAPGAESDGQSVRVKTERLDDIVSFRTIDLLISHTNGQELDILRGARRLVQKSRDLVVILQLYGANGGVIRDLSYEPYRPIRWLMDHGFHVALARKPGLRLRTPGILRHHMAITPIVNAVGIPKRRRHLWPGKSPPAPRSRVCLNLTAGERPNSWAEVDGRVLRENLHLVRIYLGRSLGGSGSAEAPPIGAVLKANAYGHGAVLAGRVLASAKIDALFVSEVETGLTLRTSPEVPKSLAIVLLYRAPLDGVICQLAEANITVSVLSNAWLREAIGWAPCASKLRLHLMVDTGLAREGLSGLRLEDLGEATASILAKPHWSLEGLYTHWCCPYDPLEMHRSHALFEGALALVRELRRTAGSAGNQPFTVHTSSSSAVLLGVHYDLLRVGGLLFGDPVAIADGAGGALHLPGPHRTLLWKSRVTSLRWSVPGERFSRCSAEVGCEKHPTFQKRILLGVIPVGGNEFSDSNVVSSSFREKLPLLEKSLDGLLVEIPSTSRTFQQASEGMEVLLCAENCIQGLFNVPSHVPRLLAQDPSIDMRLYCPPEMVLQAPYAPSGDGFYPVELNGAVYDSFNLRVVFERDKTGFEESKEFPIRTNMVVAARYQIIEYLGSAAFSRAVQCLDLDTNKMVCMKIIKNDKDFFDQSLDEIKLLKYINVNGDVDYYNVLRLYDHFYHKEHLIIVTELLRDNLYEFSKFNRECGDEPYFTIGRLQKISRQILTALDYVHSLRLIHCDLKPENILIKSYSRCEVKVIDFGSSCFIDDHLSSYVQSRSYRAPEVMLGLPYDQKIDLWSLGCILAELWTGYVLFQNDSVQSLLARILGIVGDFPYHMMTSGKYVPQYFTQDGQLYQEIEGAPCPERGRRLHLLVPKKTSLRQRMRTNDELLLDFLEKLLQLDPAQRPTAAEAMEHPFLAPGRIPDFTEDAEMLSWAGVGLGEAESYKVMCSMRNLAANQKDGLNKLRFWGKILGTEADYYVAEAQRDGGEPDENDPDAEPPGQGANQFTYYVTNDLAGDWRRLPDIKPKEIIAARAIKRLVTGNAGSKVITHPAFEGAEEVYLRAQIARITADTVICMKGYLKKEEEEGSPIEQNEEFVCPPPAELLRKEAWTHMLPHVLLNGRTTHKEIPEGDTPEELDLAAKMKEEQEADPEQEVLRGLHADGLQWTIKQAGDTTLYRASADPAAPLRSNAVTYVRSLAWPGAVTAVRNGQFVNLYVGYGLAAGSPNFFPLAPPDVQEEPEDRTRPKLFASEPRNQEKLFRP
ncbi:pom1 [Symbiodinium natans]|uniref:Pom1 protein n=1 Tax=Symbiodinium natans TaxID=878477 RepID=A0A812MX87_9DINO|nr:pom1 [Symbiodinium natans]